MSRVIRDRVADVRTLDVPVVVEEYAPDVETGRAGHLDVADEPVACKVHVIRELDSDPQLRVLESDVGDQRIFDITEVALPVGIVEPGELAIDEQAGTAQIAHGLVRISDAREVDVAHRIRGIESDERVAVADDEASGHGLVAILASGKTLLTGWVSVLGHPRLESRSTNPSSQH